MTIFLQVRVFAKAAIAASHGEFDGKAEAIVAAMRFLYLTTHGIACWGLSLFMRDSGS